MTATSRAAAQLAAPLRTYSRVAATAVHEAGHAVTAFHLGRGLTRLTINADDQLGAAGVCSTKPPGAWFRPDIEVTRALRNRVEEQVLILLAGRETEQAWLSTLADRPRTWRRQLQVGAAPDLRVAGVVAEYVTGSEAETLAYMNWLTERCRTQMGPMYWRMVGALSVELLQCGSMSAPAAADVIRRAALDRGR